MRIEQVAQEWSAGKECVGALDLGIDTCTIRVRSNAKPLLEELATYFKPFVIEADRPTVTITALEADPPAPDGDFTIKQPDLGKTKIKEEHLELDDGRIVRKRLTGMVFAFGGETNLAIGPCLANANQVVNFVNNRYIEWRLHREAQLFHAAAAIHRGAGLALAGFSGRGKSTLCLHLMSRGADFVSNDRLMVARRDGGLRMYGVPKLPRVNPGTLVNNPDLAEMLTPEEFAQFTEMDSAALWNLEQKYDVDLECCYGVGRQLLSGPMHALAILNWDRESTEVTVVQPVDLRERRDLMPAFMKSVGLFFRYNGVGTMPAETEDAYLDVLTDCTVLEISGGVDFDQAADALSMKLAEC